MGSFCRPALDRGTFHLHVTQLSFAIVTPVAPIRQTSHCEEFGTEMDVVVVESPAKAKTINKYLGQNYRVLASFGHVRDLPPKDGSVRPEDDFAMSWQVDKVSAKRVADIAKAVKDADGLVLATDPDREGEAISWHVFELLNQKKVLKDKPVRRVVFNAITKNAVLEAMANPRVIDGALVDAYLARRALDYLVGFTLSPVLWRKLPGARSAGRVQSVALRLVCDRESEIERFVREDYWLVFADLANGAGDKFTARLISLNGEKKQKLDIRSEAEAGKIKEFLDAANFRAIQVQAKPTKRNPAPPFTTSTLQQAASSRLGFGASRTMQIAQRLYEGVDIGGETSGLITYMRTDGVQMAPEAIEAARKHIAEGFGSKFLPEKPRYYSTKAKNAQEAHEAIRPTDFSRTPDQMRAILEPDQARLYELIWKRAVASQMEAAQIERTTADIEAVNRQDKALLRAVGSVVVFDGFFAAYANRKEDDSEDEEENRLPPIREGEMLERREIRVSEHSTEPPPRYTEASLIKKMEELGIGRPSTYASTMKTLEDREYVTIEQRKLIPQAKGRVVTAFLEGFFDHYVEYDFTASLEEKLDEISDGKLSWKDVLREFWKGFSSSVEEIAELRVGEVLEKLNEELAPLVFPPREDGSDPRTCPRCGNGKLSLKLGRYGAFVGCSNYPECGFTRQLGEAGDPNGASGGNSENGDKILGRDPYTDEDIYLKSGRFGPYVQRGEGKETKRASLPKGWAPETIDLEKARALLSLPRDIGKHPETGKMISAGIGRYGPFVLHDGAYANLDSVEDVFSIGLNRAVSTLADKAAKGPRRGATPAALKELGEHPDGGKITVRSGRYGPYVNHGKINATLPKGKDPESVTFEEAVAMIAAKSSSPAKKSPKKPKSK